MAKARVVLKKSKTYNFRKKRWIKDVPQIITGEDEVKAFQENGFFHTTILKSSKRKRSIEDKKDKSAKQVLRKPE